MSEEVNLQLVHDAFAAINARDLDAYCSILEDDYVWDNDAFPAPVRGRDGVRQAFAMYFTAFPDLKVELEQVISNPAGDLVVNTWRATGTHQGDFAGIAPTQRSVETRGCTVSQMRNGRIVKSTTYTDQLALIRQLTEVPKAASAD